VTAKNMYIEGTGFYTCKECHKTESLQNHTAIVHKEREQLGDRRNVGQSSCNWRRNGPNGPTLDVYDDYEKDTTCEGRAVSTFTSFVIKFSPAVPQN
jgi:ribosome-binding protein aMBF1 (putative translation factor)